jgi:hypothetical protein
MDAIGHFGMSQNTANHLQFVTSLLVNGDVLLALRNRVGLAKSSARTQARLAPGEWGKCTAARRQRPRAPQFPTLLQPNLASLCGFVCCLPLATESVTTHNSPSSTIS